MAWADVELGPTASDHKVVLSQSLRSKANEGMEILQLHGVQGQEKLGSTNARARPLADAAVRSNRNKKLKAGKSLECWTNLQRLMNVGFVRSADTF